MEEEFFDLRVEPDNEAYKKLGNNNYTYLDIISELIDNSIAAKKENSLLEVEIEVAISIREFGKSYFLIKDNAKGIEREKIGKAIALGAICGKSALNEHGFGMKQAVASIGTLEYLVTKTIYDKKAIQINEFGYGNMKCPYKEVSFQSGTEIKIKDLKSIVYKRKEDYTKYIKLQLGAIYRYFISEEMILIKLKYIDLDNLREKTWNIEKVYPIYFNLETRSNIPIITKKLKGKGWEAYVMLGIAPKGEQYSEIGVEVPKSYHPYFVNSSNQGLDIIIHNRVIQSHQLFEINLVETRDKSNNQIRGEIHLIKGFKTTITKNRIADSNNFNDLIREVKELLVNESKLIARVYPNKLTYKIISNRLFSNLQLNYPNSEFYREYKVPDLCGVVTIVKDDEAYFILLNTAKSLDVYHVFSYLDVRLDDYIKFNSAHLLAPNFDTTARWSATHIEKKYNKFIELISFNDIGIDYPIQDSEINEGN